MPASDELANGPRAGRRTKSGPVDGFPAFIPRAPWLGRDLQTLRNTILKPAADLSPWTERTLRLAMADGSGDSLIARLHNEEAAHARPLAILIHGLTGCDASAYMKTSARALLEAGYPVLRLNLRGAGASAETCRLRYHAGRSQDLRDAFAALSRDEPDLLGQGLVVVGYSLGGNMMLKFLGEEGRGAPARGIRAAVSVSAPIDLRASQLYIMRARNRIYHAYLLRRLKAETLSITDAWPLDRDEIEGIRSIYEFDERLIAPVNGFRDAEDYYDRSSARAYMAEIRVPTLVIHALDDPWVPHDAYVAFGWHTAPDIVPLFADSGGHLGFHGRGHEMPWHDRCVGRFLAAALAAQPSPPG